MLRRIRIGFVLLALLLLAPLGFLVGRTLDTLDRERELQHADVANRVFDEAEGALAELLRDEQARPADAYRRRPSGTAWMQSRPPFVLAYFEIERGGEIRTSTSEPTLDAALRAALETARVAERARLDTEALSGEATRTSPKEPARRAGIPDEPTSRRAALESEANAREPSAPEARAVAERKDERRKQEEQQKTEQEKKARRASPLAPGTALNVQSIDLISGRAKAGKSDAGEPDTEADADGPYSSSRALETLGRIAKSTAREQASSAPMLAARGAPEDAPADESELERFEDGDLVMLPRTPASDRDPDLARVAEEAEEAGGITMLGRSWLAEPAFPSARGDAADVATREPGTDVLRDTERARVEPETQVAAERASGAAAVAGDELEADELEMNEEEIAERVAAPGARPRAALALSPSRLSGERVDAERLLLYRTALDEAGGAVRQGMLVSVDALGAWLTRRVLGESELRDSLDLELRAASAPATDRLPADRYVYAYRFTEPFEMLSLQLAISPLDDGGNARNIAWLSALLVAASTLGLYAVYRTAAVAVHFAERRSNFAAAVSHELKTPLTAIRMYGEMLRDGMVPDEAKRNDYYQTITRESERLTRLIDNVLEWSKLERHEREASLVTSDPSAAIRDVVEVVGPHAESQGFEITLRLPPALPPVRHDPDALQQVLYNLIDNAIKYARGHEPRRVEVEASPAEASVAIRIRDHGPGVAANELPLVFEAFHRGEDELTRETRGTGIGLALARGLAESMHAQLDARNHPDGGLEVELRLSRG